MAGEFFEANGGQGVEAACATGLASAAGAALAHGAIRAVLLDAAGMHSVVGESVTVRAKEIAIKNALGAGRGRLARECIGRALRWVLLGEVAGLAAAFFLAHAAADLLYQVSPADPWVLSGVTLLVFAVAGGAALVPAWFAVSADPRDALQSDLG